MKAHTRVIIWLLAIGIAASSYINVHVDQPGHKVSSNLWGIFIEEISHAGDGGLYGELIKNRNLAPKLATGDLDGYAVVKSDGVDGQISISRVHPLNEMLPTSLQLEVTTNINDGQRIGISNSGFWGIPVRPDYTQYRASFYAKSTGFFRGPLTVSLEKADGSVVYASAQVDQITDQFQKYEVLLTPSADLIQQPSLDNLFIIATSGNVPSGTSIYFNVVSLFPPTFKDRPNGMKVDVAQMLADAKPRFHRFPGGNFLEGNNIAERFIWEETIGDISRRPGHQGCWGYYSSDGLGILEYAQFTEDIGATLILGVFAGYALNGETTRPEDLGQYIESALNEIEYLMGDANTTWGARRIADGRERPFDLRYVEIGNEDFFSVDYAARYPPFYDAISARYPQLEIIATTRVDTRPLPIVDDHFYQGFGWCPDNHRYYDNHPRDGPKIFVGEFACKDNYHPQALPNLAAAIDNAAWMTGLERNSDVVILACYAPLLGHINDPPGTPDAIYYNGLVTYGTPIWWVFHLFGTHQGDTFIPSDSDANNGRPNEKIFHVASRDSERNVLIVKIVNTLGEDIMIDTVELQGINGVGNGTHTILTGGRWDLNDVDNPRRVYPSTEDFNINGNSFSFNAPAFSLSVFEFEFQL